MLPLREGIDTGGGFPLENEMLALQRFAARLVPTRCASNLFTSEAVYAENLHPSNNDEALLLAFVRSYGSCMQDSNAYFELRHRYKLAG